MKRLLATTMFVLALAATPSAQGGLISIDFNDGTGDGDAIGSFYAALGITFVEAVWSDRFDGRPGTSSPFHLDSLSTPELPKIDNPIIGLFSSSVDMVSISAIDVGFNDARLDVYDAITGGNLIGTSTYTGLTEFGNTLTGIDTGVLSVSVSGIRRIELYQPNSGISNDGMAFDNLSFNVVPEPTSITMVLVVFAGVFAIRSRQRRFDNANAT